MHGWTYRWQMVKQMLELGLEEKKKEEMWEADLAGWSVNSPQRQREWQPNSSPLDLL